LSDTELGFDLSLSIGKLNDTVKSLDSYMREAARQETPLYSRTAGTGVVSAGGVAVIDLGGPQSGYLREVRSIAVGGITPTTAAPGRADVYVLSSDLINLTQPGETAGLAEWRDYTIAMPSVAFYGKGDVVLHYTERLQLLISGATAGLTYVASCSYMQMQDGPKGYTF
jgi:hypothetical protein